MLRWLARRVTFAALTLVLLAIVTYGMPRALIPERYGDSPILAGTLDDLERGFLHFDWGVACGFTGCPPIRGLFLRGFATDLWLIGGALVLGVAAGFLGAMWCARRPRTRRARVVEAVATTAYCTPVYAIGLVALLLFNGDFGLIGIPGFFDAKPVSSQPWTDPWMWFRTLLAPWVILAAPLAAMCLRLTLTLLREESDALHVRTAYAKGVAPRRVMSRHVAPAAYSQTASFVGISIPPIVLNLILVEHVLAVPGFFRYTQRATGRVLDLNGYPTSDLPLLQAISLWAGVLVVVLTVVVDLILARLDPRIRTGGLPG